MKTKTDVISLFDKAVQENNYLKVCAPMVRYSKVQFRRLVVKYGVDLCFSPMIMADSFCQSSKARYNEFTTTTNDTPLIVQFAAKSSNEFVDASKLVYPYADGVDLNCGCPQRWAMKDGYGCALLSHPEIIHSLVRSIKNTLPNNFSVSVKIRLSKDLRKSIELCCQLEKCGVSFITVHARTPSQKSSEDINVNELKSICTTANIPIVANGGVKSLHEADVLHESVQCAGIMAASGILTNPAMFSGNNLTPTDCVQQWMNIKNKDKDRITFQCYHHHLVFMLEKFLSKQEKKVFNYLTTFESVDDFLLKNVVKCNNSHNYYDEDYFINCTFPESVTEKYLKCKYCDENQYNCVCQQIYDSNTANGKYFSSHINNECDLDYMDNFIEF